MDKNGLSYEVRREEFVTSQGVDSYDFETDVVDAIYLKIGQKKILVDALKVGEHSSDPTWGEHYSEQLPLSTKEIDSILQTDKRSALSQEDLESGITKLKESQEKLLDGYSQLQTDTAKKGREIFNTLFLDDYRQQMIVETDKRRQERYPSQLVFVNSKGNGEELQEKQAEGFVVIGLEADAKFKTLCHQFIDPQHTGQKAEQSCFKELAEHMTLLMGKYKHVDPAKIVFATSKLDLDSVAAYLIAMKYLRGEKIEPNKIKDQIKRINEHDTFIGAKPKWKPSTLEDAIDPNNEMKALASVIKNPFQTPSAEDFVSMVRPIEQFIDTGKVDDKVMTKYREEKQAIIEGVGKTTKLESREGISIVISNERAATDIGYTENPIVMAYSPKTGRITIAKHDADENGKVQDIDLQKLMKKLNDAKIACSPDSKGWGPGTTILGSPFGARVEQEDLPRIFELAKECRTPEYNKQWIARKTKPNTNNGKVME